MDNSLILKTICKILLPVMMIFGLYIISFGDISPGGGFQGGAILTTAYLSFYFISENKEINLEKWVSVEKKLFLLILLIGFINFFSNKIYEINFFSTNLFFIKRMYFIILNVVIASKVCIGLICIVESFIKEDENGF